MDDNTCGAAIDWMLKHGPIPIIDECKQKYDAWACVRRAVDVLEKRFREVLEMPLNHVCVVCGKSPCDCPTGPIVPNVPNPMTHPRGMVFPPPTGHPPVNGFPKVTPHSVIPQKQPLVVTQPTIIPGLQTMEFLDLTWGPEVEVKPHPCHCDMMELMRCGCKCGGV